MKEVSREEYLDFYIYKENIKCYPKKENGIMYYNVFQNGNLIAKSEEGENETKYFIKNK